MEDIVFREHEASVQDQAARTRRGADLSAAYLQPDAGEEVHAVGVYRPCLSSQ